MYILFSIDIVVVYFEFARDVSCHALRQVYFDLKCTMRYDARARAHFWLRVRNIFYFVRKLEIYCIMDVITYPYWD